MLLGVPWPTASPPGGGDWRVVFEQPLAGKSWTVSVRYDEVGWFIVVALPGIGGPVTPYPSVGDAQVSVYAPGATRLAAGDSPQQFTFRGPRITRVVPPAAYPGDGIEVRGSLLATYRVRFQVRQTTVMSYDHFTTVEPLAGLYVPTFDEASYPLLLRDGNFFAPGDATAEVRDLAGGYARPVPDSARFQISSPVITSLTPNSGRACPTVREQAAAETPWDLRTACTTENVGAAEVRLRGRGLAIPGWPLSISLGGPVEREVRRSGNRSYTTMWDNDRVRFFIREIAALGERHELSATGPIPGGGRFDVPCTASPCSFRVTGRESGFFSVLRDNELCNPERGCHPHGPRCYAWWERLFEEGREYLEVDTPRCSAGTTEGCTFSVTHVIPRVGGGEPERISLTPTSNTYGMLGGRGGVNLVSAPFQNVYGRGDCAVLAVLSYTGSVDRYEWRVFTISGRPVTGRFQFVTSVLVEPWIGSTAHWDLVTMMSSPDGTVAIVTVPAPSPAGQLLLKAYIWNLYFSYASIHNPTTGSAFWTMAIPAPLDPVTRPLRFWATMGYNALTELKVTPGMEPRILMTDLPVWIPPPDPPTHPLW